MLILISDAFDPGLPKVLSKYGEVTEDKSQGQRGRNNFS